MTLDARHNEMVTDLSALEANVALVRSLVRPGTALIASVKANAYGHGIVPVARRLVEAGVEVLATGSFADAAVMRDSGISVPILMMGGALPTAIPDLIRRDLIPTVHCQETADAVLATSSRRTPVYVKVDCGFGRLGIPLAKAHPFILDLAGRPNVEIAGLYTHLPFADAHGMEFARARIARFDALVASLARDGLAIPVTQARASAAVLAKIDDHCSAVSPGALLYGLSPLNPGLVNRPDLRPVLGPVCTRLIQVSQSSANVAAGFETRFSSRVRGAIGVVPFGRLEGYRAPLASQDAHMLIDGVKAPVLGVSLEHTILDLSEVPDPVVGQEVVVLGRSGNAVIGLEDLALWQDCGDNDVLMAMNDRMSRRFTA